MTFLYLDPRLDDLIIKIRNLQPLSLVVTFFAQAYSDNIRWLPTALARRRKETQRLCRK